MLLRQPKRLLIVLGVLAATVVVPAQRNSTPGVIQIDGAGGTLPYAIYSAWLAEYARVRPDVRIDYLAIGSSAGIAQLTEQLTFFGATDAPLTQDEYQQAPGRILHLPTVLAAVALVYNVPGVTAELKLDPQVLASIFLGKVRNW